MNVKAISGFALVVAIVTIALAGPSKTEKVTYLVQGFRCAACVPKLEASLKTIPGVAAVSTNFGQKQITVQYDPRKTDVQAIAIAAAQARNAHDEPFSLSLILKIVPSSGQASAGKAEQALKKVSGVREARVNQKENTVTIQFAAQGKATLAELTAALRSVGYKVKSGNRATSSTEGEDGDSRAHEPDDDGHSCGARHAGCG